jgi:hypothetical protein
MASRVRSSSSSRFPFVFCSRRPRMSIVCWAAVRFLSVLWEKGSGISPSWMRALEESERRKVVKLIGGGALAAGGGGDSGFADSGAGAPPRKAGSADGASASLRPGDRRP